MGLPIVPNSVLIQKLKLGTNQFTPAVSTGNRCPARHHARTRKLRSAVEGAGTAAAVVRLASRHLHAAHGAALRLCARRARLAAPDLPID